jgi:hypothetical protein
MTESPGKSAFGKFEPEGGDLAGRDVIGSLGPEREENIKLKRLVADLSLDKLMMQDVLQKSSEACQEARDRELPDGPIWGGQPQSVSLRATSPVDVLLSEQDGPADRVAPTRA